MTFPLGGFGFQVWFIETGVECRLIGTAGSRTGIGGSFSNRDLGVPRWGGKYGLAAVLSSKGVKALVRPI
jgi:aldehyde:ferredoxin oxidoreductase